MKRLLVFSCLVVLFSACTVARHSINDKITSIRSLRFVGEYDVPHKLQFQGTTVGGLSSIDFDEKHDVYYMVCDDRSDINPARFYTAKIYINSNGIDSVQFTDVKNLLQSNGNVYPNSKQDPYHTPDPEALRYNPITDLIVWNSEGERILKKDTIILENPAITISGLDGRYIDTFPLPPLFRMSAKENGPRRNGVFEGSSFANGYTNFYVNVEEPIYEDGSRAGLGDSTGWIRIIKFDVLSKQMTAQYAYQIDPVPYPAETPGAFKINGVPDILHYGNNKLLVIERAFSTGRKGCVIKVYEGDMNAADNIANVTSLNSNPPAKPIAKRLLLNMESLGIYIDNVEGVTFGPTLPNGHRTLIFVADDNFDATEKTQFFLFEIIP